MNESLFAVVYSLAHRSAGLDQLIIFCATRLPVIVGVLAIVGAIILASRDYHARDSVRRLAFIISAPAVTWLIAHILKISLAWPRPTLALTNIEPLFTADGLAFPSGHASFFFALTFALHPFHPRLAGFVATGAIVISLARVAAGVHWPGDILGGFVLAGVVVFISWTIAKTRFPALASPGRY
ncbi:MAG: phosphatase PAP2 family protein [Patescibacteria group bacterium]